MLDEVLTIKGEFLPRNKVRKIAGNYYSVGDTNKKNSGDCYLIDSVNKYYRDGTGKIVWHNDYGKYILISELQPTDVRCYIAPGVQEYVDSRKHQNLIKSKDGDVFVSYEVALKSDYVFSKHDGQLCHKNRAKNKEYSKEFSKNTSFYNSSRYPHEHYNMSGHPMLTNTIKEVNKLEVKIPDWAEYLYSIFPNLTFGTEFETYIGRLPEIYLMENGLIPLKDGSIYGIEYVTVPLSGPKGYAILANAAKALSEYTAVDQFCSLHNHIGLSDFLKANKASKQDHKIFLLALYMGYYQIQKEIWDIIPSYKKDVKFLAKKPGMKDHCQDLKSLNLFRNSIIKNDGSINVKELDTHFKNFFRFWNDGHPMNSDFNMETKQHSKGNTQKWNIMSRYYNFNMFNTLFSNSNTVEFRAHHGTVNPYKTIYWLIINLAFVDYCWNRRNDIIASKVKLDLYSILEEYNEHQIIKDVIEYLDYKRKQSIEAFFKNDTMLGNEFSNDDNFKFGNVSI